MDVAASEFWLESDKVERPLEYPHLLTDLNPDSLTPTPTPNPSLPPSPPTLTLTLTPYPHPQPSP